jgi:hypothetical protein
LLTQVGDRDRWGRVAPGSRRPILLVRTGDEDDLELARALVDAQVAEAASDADLADALLRSALVRVAQGDGDIEPTYRRITELARGNDDYVLLALALNNLVESAMRAGRLGEAARCQRESLSFAAELQMEHVTLFSLILAARIAEAAGDDNNAVRLHSLATTGLAEAGIALFPDDLRLSDEMTNRARQRLVDDCFRSAEESGRQMALYEALQVADAIFSDVSVQEST